QTGPDSAAFAASNSSAFVFGNQRYVLGIGGKAGAHILLSPLLVGPSDSGPCKAVAVPIAGGRDSAGVFSIYFRNRSIGLSVGGDYTNPNDPSATAAWSVDGGLHWTASTIPPRGSPSTVQWS